MVLLINTEAGWAGKAGLDDARPQDADNADPDTIELRDTERFLRERRPFFREGDELFATPLNIYYSRLLTDIDAGAIAGVRNRV